MYSKNSLNVLRLSSPHCYYSIFVFRFASEDLILNFLSYPNFTFTKLFGFIFSVDDKSTCRKQHLEFSDWDIKSCCDEMITQLTDKWLLLEHEKVGEFATLMISTYEVMNGFEGTGTMLYRLVGTGLKYL